MNPRVHPGADAAIRCALVNLCVRADADLSVLAPRALLDQHLLQCAAS
jgi:hypothetical protein